MHLTRKYLARYVMNAPAGRSFQQFAEDSLVGGALAFVMPFVAFVELLIWLAGCPIRMRDAIRRELVAEGIARRKKDALLEADRAFRETDRKIDGLFVDEQERQALKNANARKRLQRMKELIDGQ